MIVVRILGRVIIRVFAGIGRFARRHEGVVGLLIVLAIVAGVGVALVSSFVDVSTLLGTQSAAASVSAPTPTLAPTATISATTTPAIVTPATTITQRDAPQNTEAFMHAEHDYDATALWKTLSPDFQQKLTGNGQGQDYFVQQFAQQKQSGLVMTSYQYIAGQPVANGQSFHFYVATFKDTQGKETPIPFSFHLDANSMIISTSIG